MSVPITIPNVFVNGTVADATQVDANFTAVANAFGTAAANGVNTDITALQGLQTPIAPGNGGTTIFVGQMSTGSANQQSVLTTVPNSFVLTPGFRAAFIAGFTNTAAMTLNVHSTGDVNVFRKTQFGTSLTAGGEVISGHPVSMVYDGIKFLLDGEIRCVGEIRDFVGSSPPPGSLFANGQAISRTQYADLFTLISTTYGAGDGTSTFNIPDLRGRVAAGNDAMGVAAAGRIGTALSTDGGTINGQTTGSVGGSSTHSLVAAEIGPHQHDAFIHEPGTAPNQGHEHPVQVFTTVGATSPPLIQQSSGGAIATTNANNGAQFAVTGVKVNSAPAGAGTDDQTGSVHYATSQAAAAWLQPTMITNKVIYF
jgi:microcystin-dependent protein